MSDFYIIFIIIKQQLTTLNCRTGLDANNYDGKGNNHLCYSANAQEFNTGLKKAGVFQSSSSPAFNCARGCTGRFSSLNLLPFSCTMLCCEVQNSHSMCSRAPTRSSPRKTLAGYLCILVPTHECVTSPHAFTLSCLPTHTYTSHFLYTRGLKVGGRKQ